MRVAVVGSGISGLSSALMAKTNGHQVTLFEKGNYFGGHSNTIEINDGKLTFPVDTGFLVHNRKTYPNLIKLFESLGVNSDESQMTLSIQILSENVEWGGTSLATLFGQKRNIFSPRFYRMIKDILNFNKRAPEFLEAYRRSPEMTLGDLLKAQAYSDELRDWYLIPMAAAIWSTPASKILDFPAYTFLQFCINHNLLQVNDRPIWRTVSNGSREYVRKITDQIEDKRLSAEVKRIEKRSSKTIVILSDGREEVYDIVILAGHADQSLRLLANPSATHKDILSPFKFQKNRAVVHCDETLLPKRKKLWSAWNYVSSKADNNVCVSYLINHLQKLPTAMPVIVTLNPSVEIRSDKVFRVIDYDHPLFDAATITAQKRIDEIQGVDEVYFVGAWLGYGFHEDGLNSSLRLAEKLGWKKPWS